jgi:hypothetical protein
MAFTFPTHFETLICDIFLWSCCTSQLNGDPGDLWDDRTRDSWRSPKKDGWSIQQRALAAQNTGETPRKIGLEAAKMVTPTKTVVSSTSY